MVRATRMGGGGGGGGSGTVTSVALAMPAIFSVAGSPVTTAGTITVTLATETANTVFAGPTSGGAAAPTFRALVAADYPTMGGDAGAGGTKGAVPAPAAGDAAKVLSGAGTWVAQTAAAPVSSVFGRTGAVVAVAGDYGPTLGGTGQTTYATGDMLYASGANTLAKLAAGTNGYVLTMAGGVPTWAAAGGSTAQWLSSAGQFLANTAVIASGDQVYIQSRETNGATQVAHVLDTENTFSTSGAKLLSVRNNTSEKFFIDYTGNVAIGAVNAGDGNVTFGDAGNNPPTIRFNGSGDTGAKFLHISGYGGSSTSFGFRFRYNVHPVACAYDGTVGNVQVLPAGRFVLDAATVNSDGDSYITKSAATGGNLSTFYDATEITRDDGTNCRVLASRGWGLYTAIGDTNASVNLIGSGVTMGAGGATAVDVRVRRSAANVFTLDNAGGGGATQEFIEMTAPSAPAANTVRIYAEDNGAGKTRLMALFNTGAAQQIAIEP